MNKYAVWFRWLVILGVLVNLFFGLPGILIPNAVLNFAGVPPAAQPVWTAFASLLLVLLSLFYMPAAIDMFRYRPNACLAVFARLAGVFFFLVLAPHEYAVFGYIDLFFLITQATALVAALRAGPAIEDSGG